MNCFFIFYILKVDKVFVCVYQKRNDFYVLEDDGDFMYVFVIKFFYYYFLVYKILFVIFDIMDFSF